MCHKMMKVIKTSTKWTDHIVFAIRSISLIALVELEIMRPYGEFTNIPRMDVELKDGLIEKRPLQVAGALTLPAAVHVQLSEGSPGTICDLQSPAMS